MLNLEQAIKDVTLANERVRDLTQRLLDISDKLLQSQSQCIDLEFQLSRTQTELDRIRGSKSFRLASSVSAIISTIK